MLDWINALQSLYGDIINFFWNAPLYGSVTVGPVIIAIAFIGIIIKSIIVRVK